MKSSQGWTAIRTRSSLPGIYAASAGLASLLAKQRDLDSELAAITGLLHDLYSYHTGIGVFHAGSGAEMIRPILRDCGLFSSEEQRLLICTVFYHSDKALVHGPYDELLKDADALQHYLDDTSCPVAPWESGPHNRQSRQASYSCFLLRRKEQAFHPRPAGPRLAHGRACRRIGRKTDRGYSG